MGTTHLVVLNGKAYLFVEAYKDTLEFNKLRGSNIIHDGIYNRLQKLEEDQWSFVRGEFKHACEFQIYIGSKFVNVKVFYSSWKKDEQKKWTKQCVNTMYFYPTSDWCSVDSNIGNGNA
ncbi:MAG: hypothetical protein QW303_01205 [Nitrososphaerota archaeon]